MKVDVVRHDDGAHYGHCIVDGGSRKPRDCNACSSMSKADSASIGASQPMLLVHEEDDDG